ncbi:hypothetical protein [Elongatibacter sediminis]|uniref:Uncharacterized protein n=1 Tax=Elongatibacter sediminis TaxID=3119006 RepID=A0AAW9R8Y4_9GAMM
MSEYEYFEAYYILQEGLVETSMNVLVALFAYLAASHFAGAKLKSAAAVTLSAIYTVFLTNPVMGVYTAAVSMHSLAASFANAYPESELPIGEFSLPLALAFVLTPIFFGWCSSIWYLHFIVRHPEYEGGA